EYGLPASRGAAGPGPAPYGRCGWPGGRTGCESRDASTWEPPEAGWNRGENRPPRGRAGSRVKSVTPVRKRGPRARPHRDTRWGPRRNSPATSRLRTSPVRTIGAHGERQRLKRSPSAVRSGGTSEPANHCVGGGLRRDKEGSSLLATLSIN